jgi:hypothetical protein
MGYDICIKKPEVERRNNRLLADEVLKTFPEFVEFPIDHSAMARSIATEYGFTEAEWLKQHMGIELNYETTDSWFQMTFWKTEISISVLNFHVYGSLTATDRLLPYIDFFVRQGFTLLDPETGDDVSSVNARKAIIQGFQTRQQLVRTVAQISGGTAVGDSTASS